MGSIGSSHPCLKRKAFCFAQTRLSSISKMEKPGNACFCSSPREVRSGFLCAPQTGASVPMLLLYSALEQARNTVWLLHVCLPKTRALITQSNDTTFGFALSIVLTFLSNTLGPDSPFAPYLFLRKAAFQHFDEAKKDGISHMAHFIKGACPNQCKRGLLQGRPLPVVYTSQRHFCLFLPSHLSRLTPPDG